MLAERSTILENMPIKNYIYYIQRLCVREKEGEKNTELKLYEPSEPGFGALLLHFSALPDIHYPINFIWFLEKKKEKRKRVPESLLNYV